ncbi:MAG TPA: hypothetical protein ENN19_04595 [Chloroflexi bacterium]|nr:hypothetical protein [Chloroflexota bacterium]
MRGGSFDNTDNNVRCAYRNNRNNPNNRNRNNGFRVVASTFLGVLWPELWRGCALKA